MFPRVFSVQYNSAAIVVSQGSYILFSVFFSIFESVFPIIPPDVPRYYVFVSPVDPVLLQFLYSFSSVPRVGTPFQATIHVDLTWDTFLDCWFGETLSGRFIWALTEVLWLKLVDVLMSRASSLADVLDSG